MTIPQDPDGITDVAKAIQLALAPVFLLTGVAGLLNVMTGRLSRIIDRGRVLTEETGSARRREDVEREVQSLETRRHFTSVAITACTMAALLLCVVIVAMFVEVLLGAPLRWAIAVLFSAATLVLVVGLAYFLREVHLATKSRIRLRPRDPP